MPSWRLVTAVLVTMLVIPLLVAMPSAWARPPADVVPPESAIGPVTELTPVAEPAGEGARVPGVVAIGTPPGEPARTSLPVTGSRLVLLGLISLGLGVAGLVAGRDRTGRRRGRAAREIREDQQIRVG